MGKKIIYYHTQVNVKFPHSHLHGTYSSLQASPSAKGDDGKVVLVADLSQGADLLHTAREHHHIWRPTSRQ